MTKRDEAFEAMRKALQKIVNNWDELHPKDRRQARAALRLAEEGERG
jgi:hypothetical protein